jgi:hypothetical protein
MAGKRRNAEDHMTMTASTLDELTLNITQRFRANAPLEPTFAAMLEELGPHNQQRDGTPMPMTIEVKPGKRWYRDLGNDNGHLRGYLRAIKDPLSLRSSDRCSCPTRWSRTFSID